MSQLSVKMAQNTAQMIKKKQLHSSEQNGPRATDDVVVSCQVKARKFSVGGWKEIEFPPPARKLYRN